MPASASIQTGVGLDLAGAWKDFLKGETTARDARNTTWAGFPGGNPASDGQAAFNTYASTVEGLFVTAQSTLGTSINQVAQFMQSAFDSFQSILGGGGIMSQVTLAGALFDVGLNSCVSSDSLIGVGVGQGGGGGQEVIAGSDTNAVFITASIAEAASMGNTQGGIEFEFNNAPVTMASEVTLSAEQSSKAICSIQFKNKEDTVPAVAAVSKGPSGKLKLGDRVKIDVRGPGNIPLMVGSIINIAEHMGSDGTAFTVEDDKYHLRGVHVIGSFHYDPADDITYYRQRGLCRFNPNGRPNCIDSKNGPRFALYPDYAFGLSEEVTAPKDDVDSTGTGVLTPPATFTGNTANNSKPIVARYWKFIDVIEYLKFACYGTSCTGLVGNFPWYMTLSDGRVVWPTGLGSGVLNDGDLGMSEKATAAGIKTADHEGGLSAKVPDMDIEGMDLEATLQRIVQSAGAYAIYMHPLTSGKSVIKIVPTKYRKLHESPAAKKVARYAGTTAKKNEIVVSDATLERDGGNCYSSVLVNGDIAFLEKRFVFDPPGQTAAGDPANSLETRTGWATQELVPAWTKSDEDFLRKYIKDNALPVTLKNTPEGFIQAVSIKPLVFCAFRIQQRTPGSVPIPRNNNTKYEGFPEIPAPPPVLSHLLTWTAETGVDRNLKRRLPCAVRVEIKIDTGTDGIADTWVLLSENDGFELDEQGNIYFPGLREAALSAQTKGTFTGSVRDATGATTPSQRLLPRPIRITLAAYMDNRLTHCVAANTSEFLNPGNNALGMLSQADPNATSSDITERLDRQYVAFVDDAYREYLRHDAFPYPEAANQAPIKISDGSTVDPIVDLIGPRKNNDADGKNSSPLLSDEPFMVIHGRRRYAGVSMPQRSAHLKFDTFAIWEPGTVVNMLTTKGSVHAGDFPILGVVNRLRVDYDNQIVEMDLT